LSDNKTDDDQSELISINMINRGLALLAVSAFLFTSCGDQNKQTGTSGDKPDSVEQIESTANEAHAEIVDMSVADFNSLVSSQPFVVVDFYATWCRPCIKMAPHLKKIASEYEDNQLKVVKIDAEKNVSLSTAHNIKGYPTLKLFKDGKEVKTKMGGLNEAQLRALFAEYM